MKLEKSLTEINKILKPYKREVRGGFTDNPGYMELRDIREDKERLIRTSEQVEFNEYLNLVIQSHEETKTVLG